MSPSRTRKPTVHTRPRSEVVVAVGAAVGIALGTVLLVWAMRPGPPGVPGTGGILTRQPRVTLLVVLGGSALALGIWWVQYGRHRPRRVKRRLAVSVTAFAVIVGIVLAWVFWPGGVVRHYRSFSSNTDLTTPTQPAATTATTPAK